MVDLIRPRKPLSLRDGGQPLPGGTPGPLTHGPMSPAFWGAMAKGIGDTARPMVQEVQQFNDDYPMVGQVAQLAAQPLNLAAGVHGVVKSELEGDHIGAAASALSAIPVLGRYAGKSLLAGTKRSVRQFQQVRAMGLRPSADMVGQAAGRVIPDAGGLIQAGELGEAAYKTTSRLRGPSPGPFYGGN